MRNWKETWPVYATISILCVVSTLAVGCGILAGMEPTNQTQPLTFLPNPTPMPTTNPNSIPVSTPTPTNINTIPHTNPDSPIPMPVQIGVITAAQGAELATGFPFVPIVSTLGMLISLIINGIQKRQIGEMRDAMENAHATIPQGVTGSLPLGSTSQATWVKIVGP